MKILYVLPLLAVSAIHAVPEANALALDNGRNMNGRNMNGLATNGLSTNGLSINGIDRDEAGGHATTVILKDGERISRQ